MRIARSTILIVAATTALPATALAQKPTKPPKPTDPPTQTGGAPALTLGSMPNKVVFGSVTTLSGRLTGKDAGNRTIRVELDAFPYGDGFGLLGTTVTKGNGTYSLQTRPTRNSRYQAVTAGGPTVRTGIHQLFTRRRVGLTASDLTPRRRQLVRFSGSVAPASVGKSVLVQRRSPTGRWVTVGRTSTVAAGSGLSRYSKRTRVFRTGTYRVKVVGDAALVNGFSRTRTLTVG